MKSEPHAAPGTREAREQARIRRRAFLDRLTWGMVLALFVCTCFLAHSAFAGVQHSELTVAFLDVGQGDAVFIETPSGRQVLIDGGKNRAVLSALADVMGFRDRSLDVVIATHPDLDHIGGLPHVFTRYDVSMALEPGVLDDGADYEAFISAVHAEGLEPILGRAGMKLELEEGITLQLLFPQGDASRMEANSASIVLRLTYGETSFLFMGDAPVAIERYLTAQYASGLQSDVLKLGHHGSKTSTSEEFLVVVSPEHAVVSAGCHNQYGHPHAVVLGRLEVQGVAVWDTCTEGTVVFQSDGMRTHAVRN